MLGRISTKKGVALPLKLCVDCGERQAYGSNTIGYAPELCEYCNIQVELRGERGIDEDDCVCVLCGRRKEGGAETTLCNKCKAEIRKKYGVVQAGDPFCVKCGKRPRRRNTVLCLECSRAARELRRQLQRELGIAVEEFTAAGEEEGQMLIFESAPVVPTPTKKVCRQRSRRKRIDQETLNF